MKILSLLFNLFFLQSFTNSISTCNQKILSFYGLEGVTVPVDYLEITKQTQFDYCPGTQSSCCTSTDFLKTRDLWIEKSKNIQGYLRKYLNIIEKTVAMQGFLVNLASKASKNESKFCSQINFDFFNQKIEFQRVYFFLQNSLKIFAELQKGFYCSICDAEFNSFFAVERNNRIVNIMSANFCSNIVNVFREFIHFKINYIDPMILNTNFLMNCYYGVNTNKFDFYYEIPLLNINNCINQGGTGKDCILLCQEFQIGKASDMFIGNLSEYEKFIANLEDMSKKYDGTIDIDRDNLFIDPNEKYERDFFITENSTDPTLKQYDLSTIPIEVSGLGFDFYSKAEKSSYGYNGEMDQVLAQSLGQEQVVNDASYTNFNSVVDEKTLKDPTAKEKFEEAHQAQKFEETEEKPDMATIESSNMVIEEKEKELFKSISREGSLETVKLSGDTLGEGAKIAKGFGEILQKMILSFFFLII